MNILNIIIRDARYQNKVVLDTMFINSVKYLNITKTIEDLMCDKVISDIELYYRGQKDFVLEYMISIINVENGNCKNCVAKFTLTNDWIPEIHVDISF